MVESVAEHFLILHEWSSCEMQRAHTEVHVISLWSLWVRDPFIHRIQQLIFHLSHRVTVQHLHRDLSSGVSLWRNAHQGLKDRKTMKKGENSLAQSAKIINIEMEVKIKRWAKRICPHHHHKGHEGLNKEACPTSCNCLQRWRSLQTSRLIYPGPRRLIHTLF